MKKLTILLLALLCAMTTDARPMKIVREYPASAPEVRYVGRTLVEGDNVSFDWSGTYFEVRFTGSYLAIRASDTGKNYYNLIIDGENRGVVTTQGSETLVLLASGLAEGEHTARLQKRTEGEQGRTTVHAVLVFRDEKLLPAPPVRERHIEFIGNSLTCGFGTEGLAKDEPFKPETENCDKGYACIIARYFGADYNLVAHSGRGVARNYGAPNTTSENTMADRIANTFDEQQQPWPLFKSAASHYRPDLVVIHLGTNDFTTLPHPSREEFRMAYERILYSLRGIYGLSVPILCVAPSKNDPAFEYVREIATKTSAGNIHFAAILPGYCNDGSDLGSVGHPNYQGQRKMATALIPYVATAAGWEMEAKPVE